MYQMFFNLDQLHAKKIEMLVLIPKDVWHGISAFIKLLSIPLYLSLRMGILAIT